MLIGSKRQSKWREDKKRLETQELMACITCKLDEELMARTICKLDGSNFIQTLIGSSRHAKSHWQMQVTISQNESLLSRHRDPDKTVQLNLAPESMWKFAEHQAKFLFYLWITVRNLQFHRDKIYSPLSLIKTAFLRMLEDRCRIWAGPTRLHSAAASQ